jgi:putative hydrolase of the HAD superfamily
MSDIAIIYDLDETILPASAMPDETFDSLYDALKKANKGAVPDDKLKEALQAMRRISVEIVAKDFGFTEEMNQAAKEALQNTNYEFDLSPYEDFPVLKTIPGQRYLVTTGVPNLQQAKVDALFEEDDFTEVFIDDIYLEHRLGKKKLFEQIAEKTGLSADQIWIVGDNPESEIKAGNELGMNTVHIARPGVEPSKEAKFQVYNLEELKSLVTQGQQKEA